MDTQRLSIQLIGAGRIGSTIAYHLARAGHDVSVVARGERHAALQREGAILTKDGQRAPVKVLAAVDTGTPYDLAIVTAPEHQALAWLPEVAATRAQTVLLLFNAFRSRQSYAEVIGAARLASGFPNMLAFLADQRLDFRVDGPGMVTTLSTPALAALFRAAGLPAEVEPDMDAFLRSHVAMVMPLFLAALATWQRPGNLSWTEARQLERGWTEGFELVRDLGHAIRPRAVAVLSRLSPGVRTALLWLFSRSDAVKKLGEFGPLETQALIDAMVEAAPGRTPCLLSLRP